MVWFVVLTDHRGSPSSESEIGLTRRLVVIFGVVERLDRGRTGCRCTCPCFASPLQGTPVLPPEFEYFTGLLVFRVFAIVYMTNYSTIFVPRSVFLNNNIITQMLTFGLNLVTIAFILLDSYE